MIEPEDTMTDSNFRLFSKLIYRETGIFMDVKKKALLINLLKKRLKYMNITSFYKYYRYVKKSGDKDELARFIDEVTTNVTSFFRDPKQFERVKKLIFTKIIPTRRKKTLDILSAGCSTGQEPYSIALLAREELLPRLPDWRISVSGVDICESAIVTANNGEYEKDDIESLPKKYLLKYFTQNQDKYTISNDIKEMVELNRRNLITQTIVGKYDIIYCRNVVIYFDKHSKNIVYNKFHHALKKDGYLIVGHSEGLMGDPRFKFHTPGIYRKVLNEGD